MRAPTTRHRSHGNARWLGTVVAVLVGAAAIGAIVGTAPALDQHQLTPKYTKMIHGCTVVDGDTLRCGSERVRLLGIDAPELAGHCRGGRECVEGDPVASTQSLRDAVSADLQIERFGEDRYGRTLAAIAGKNGDLSCWQLKHGQAIYKPTWDNAARIARTCPGALYTSGGVAE